MGEGPKTRLVCHNLIGFDNDVLSTFLGSDVLSDFELIDTLVISRLLNYNMPGGHSLEAWGERLGEPKSKFNSFEDWSQELEDRCILDTSINLRVYDIFKKYLDQPEWRAAIELEHNSAWLCRDLHRNGFAFDYDKAILLQKELTEKVNKLRASFKEIFLPKTVAIKEITPRATKSGTINATDFRWYDNKDLRPFTINAPFTLFTYEEFNPNSPKQRVERLNAAGWKPINKTKGHLKALQEYERAKRNRNTDKQVLQGLETKLEHYSVYGWTVDDENLETLPEDAPAAIQSFVQYLLFASRLSSIEEWLGLYNHKTGRLHAQFNHIGSWPHRKSHQGPNMANVPALVNRKGGVQPYGAEFRSLFKASEGHSLVGVDAEGIQLRIFAHLCNDLRLIDAIEKGQKELGTDIHTLNKNVLGTICNSREVSKTYIYALLLTAGLAKQASILNCSKADALEGLKRILEYYPGWQELREGRLKTEGQKGMLVGLDGRKVLVASPHKVLAGHLQNGESVIMKMAARMWNEELRKLQIPYLFVDDVHDEWQTETLPEFAVKVGEVQTNSIVRVGEMLGLRCRLAGKAVIGQNWKETH
jgi:DNA polymerase I-like protein with 3'-5' exonuclease and polymerase domains